MAPAAGGGHKHHRRSSLSPEFEARAGEGSVVLPPTGSLDERVDRLQNVSVTAERKLTYLESYLMAQIGGDVGDTVLASHRRLGHLRVPLPPPSLRWRVAVARGHWLIARRRPGTPIRQAVGTVIYSGFREGYGKAAVIDHGYGIRTLFAHTSKLFIHTGQRVRRGEIVAEVGSTGHSTGPHLHYEIRKNGVPVNPVTFFSRARF